MYLIFALNEICKKNDITEILLKVALNTMTLTVIQKIYIRI